MPTWECDQNLIGTTNLSGDTYVWYQSDWHDGAGHFGQPSHRPSLFLSSHSHFHLELYISLLSLKRKAKRQIEKSVEFENHFAVQFFFSSAAAGQWRDFLIGTKMCRDGAVKLHNTIHNTIIRFTIPFTIQYLAEVSKSTIQVWGEENYKNMVRFAPKAATTACWVELSNGES